MSKELEALEKKLPDDGNGDDDAYNKGWNDCRERVLATLSDRQEDETAAENAKAHDRAALAMIGMGYYWDGEAWVRSSRQEVAPVADDKAARDLYVRWVDSQNIHCNRFPSWGELDEETRNGWRSRVSPHPPRLQAAIDQLNGTTSPAHTSEARDAARLDWLEANGCDHLWRKPENDPAERWYDSRTSVEAGSDRFQSLRDAVDAAMRQEAGDE